MIAAKRIAKPQAVHTAGAGDQPATTIPAPASLTLAQLHERVRFLEARLGFVPLPESGIEDWINSEESIAEFKRACRSFALGNRSPLEAYSRKTGGRMPR